LDLKHKQIDLNINNESLGLIVQTKHINRNQNET
jgi:hypothetical protein